MFYNDLRKYNRFESENQDFGKLVNSELTSEWASAKLNVSGATPGTKKCISYWN